VNGWTGFRIVAGILIDRRDRRGGGYLDSLGRLGRRGRLLRIEQLASPMRPLLVESEQACRAAGESGYPLSRLANHTECDDVLY
jgi:hypothetical protein